MFRISPNMEFPKKKILPRCPGGGIHPQKRKKTHFLHNFGQISKHEISRNSTPIKLKFSGIIPYGVLHGLTCGIFK